MEFKQLTSDQTSAKSSRNMNIVEKASYSWQLFFLHHAAVHFFGLYGIMLIWKGQIGMWTIVFAEILTNFSLLGVTIGAHRLWSHRTFKARTPLKIILAIAFAFTGQHSLWHWTANHRIHHKFADTEKDPHDSTRGFFYSHIGWLLNYDHSKFLRNVKYVDVSDLEKDKVVMFHDKYHPFSYIPCLYILPTLVPWYFFGEPLFNAFCVAACLRLAVSSHRAFLVNSVAHLWGYKPYDSTIRPVENRFISFLALGEGWHNYHHVFPWDYKTSELGFYRWNFSTAVIDFFAWIGWAYDLKTVDKDVIAKRVKRTGNLGILNAS